MPAAVFFDQLGRTVQLPTYPPRRIVSLVPSQTELLQALGMEAEVVGITKFCVHPADWFASKKRVGGTKTVDLEKVAALLPDLVIANQEENERDQVEYLAERFPVWVSDVKDLPTALDMIRGVGMAVGKGHRAAALVADIHSAFAALPDPAEPPLAAAYLIWRKPYMAAGGDTFIHHLLEIAGFSNVFKEKSRYPVVSAHELADARPRVVLLSSEPYPFKEKHLDELAENCPESQVLLVDGEMFSWYGSRLLLAPPYFRELRLKLSLADNRQNP